MPMLFGDHMVLQQDSKITVYGNADAGESVEVSFAGQNVKTAAGPDGKWIVYLKHIKPNSAGQPLTVTGRNRIVYDDVVVGDVWVREGQLKTLGLPNTAMAVTIEIGDPFELHPADKYDVGHRLALAARRLAYGEKIVGMGPLYKKMTVKGDKIIVEFDNQGKKLMVGTSPYVPAGKEPKTAPTRLSGFGIAGADRKFVWADAVIEGNKVIVSAPGVTEPVAVRYGFSQSPVCNLYNEAGLPASPFRTDD